MALSEITEDRKRPFMLSTPHLDGPGSITLTTTFADPRLDDLFRMKRTPRPYGEIVERFAGAIDGDGCESIFKNFFTGQAPPRPPRFEQDGLRIRYFGHGCLLIESRGVRILTDPIVAYTYEAQPPRFTYEDLPEEIDYVLITHSHHDHILLETLLQLRHMTKEFL